MFRRLISILLLVVISLSHLAPKAAAQLRSSGKRKLVAQVSPEYPALARKMHLSGTVRLLATVNAAGKVTKTELLGGNPVLAEAAADAAVKSRWESGTAETKEMVEVKFQPESD